MLDNIGQLISTYGYAAVAVGTFFEGETVLVIASVAAQGGYLELPWVILAAFLGTLAGDQLYFHIGRAKGDVVLDQRPAWRARAERVFGLLERHQVKLILGYRFLYGLRTVIPFAIGAGGVGPWRFLLLDILGVGLWAIIVGVLGFLFGRALELVIGDIQRYQLWFFAGVALVGLAVWLVRRYARRRADGGGA